MGGTLGLGSGLYLKPLIVHYLRAHGTSNVERSRRLDFYDALLQGTSVYVDLRSSLRGIGGSEGRIGLKERDRVLFYLEVMRRRDESDDDKDFTRLHAAYKGEVEGLVGAGGGGGDGGGRDEEGIDLPSPPLSQTGYEGEISRDVPRTFPLHPLFEKGRGREMLGNVLKVLARLHPRIRYCQGMNCVAGALLIAGGGEGKGRREDRERESKVRREREGREAA